MGSIIQMRRIAMAQSFKPAEVKQEVTTPDFTLQEKHTLARELVKSGEASGLKEAWQILREKGIHK